MFGIAYRILLHSVSGCLVQTLHILPVFFIIVVLVACVFSDVVLVFGAPSIHCLFFLSSCALRTAAAAKLGLQPVLVELFTFPERGQPLLFGHISLREILDYIKIDLRPHVILKYPLVKRCWCFAVHYTLVCNHTLHV